MRRKTKKGRKKPQRQLEVEEEQEAAKAEHRFYQMGIQRSWLA